MNMRVPIGRKTFSRINRHGQTRPTGELLLRGSTEALTVDTLRSLGFFDDPVAENPSPAISAYLKNTDASGRIRLLLIDQTA